MLLLKTIKTNKTSFYDPNIKYKLGIVEAPDFNNRLECGGGLHWITPGHADWSLLATGDCLYVIAETINENIVKMKDKIKTKRANILAITGNTKDLSRYALQFENIDSEWAYNWARNIGDRKIMRDKITESELAYYWARDIGDRDIMRERITEQEWAYFWADFIGDRDIMRDKITEQKWAYMWARYIGDRDIMRERITEPIWACYWALDIGDRELMKAKITDPMWAQA